MEEALSNYNFYSCLNHVLYLFIIRFVISELKKVRHFKDSDNFKEVLPSALKGLHLAC